MTSIASCDTCKIVSNNDPELIAGSFWTVRLAKDQGYIGRSYVTLRAHKGSLRDLSNEEWQEFQDIVRRLETAASSAFNSQVQNWACMMNDAFKTDPANPHVHWHFRPRYRQDVQIGGETFSDPYFGSHYDRDQRNYVSDELFQTIFKHLKKYIDQP